MMSVTFEWLTSSDAVAELHSRHGLRLAGITQWKKAFKVKQK